jgi:outer membrane protein
MQLLFSINFFIMRYILISVFLLCSFVANASDLKIGIINSSVIEADSLVIKDITNKVKITTEKIQKDVEKKENELKKEVQDLEKKRSVLSETALSEKQQALQQKVMSWQENLKRDNDAMERAKIDSLSEVDIKAKNIVDEIAKKHNLDIVLSSQGLLYSNPDAVEDITSDFIKELNNTIKSSDFDDYFKKYSKSNKK